MEFYIIFVSKYCVIKMHFLDHLPDDFKWYALFYKHKKNQHHQTKILDVSIFSQLVAKKGYFWSETTVIFFKKTAKDVHFGNVKIK